MPDRSGERRAEPSKETAQHTAKAETSSPHTRRYRTVLFRIALLATVIAFAALIFLAKTTPYFPIDLQITHAIQEIESPFFAGLMTFVSWPGFLPQSILIVSLIGFTLYIYGLHLESLTSFLAATFAGATTELIKVMIQRPRPAPDLVDVLSALTSYSFPSGHVMFYMTSFGFIWYLSYTLLRRSLKRTFLLGFFGILILTIGMSRIYLGHHWASDVLGAYLLGSLTLLGIIRFYQWGKKRFFLRQPVAPDDSSG
jgi:membrane-associated phospholipid phosphatase